MVPKCAPICIFKKVNTTAKDWCMQWKLVPSVHRGMCGTSIKELQTSFLLNSLSSCFMILSFIRQDFLWKELSINGNKTRDTNFKNTLLTWKMCGKKQNKTEALLMSVTWLFLRGKALISGKMWDHWALPSRSFIFYTCVWFFMFLCQLYSLYFIIFFN